MRRNDPDQTPFPSADGVPALRVILPADSGGLFNDDFQLPIRGGDWSPDYTHSGRSFGRVFLQRCSSNKMTISSGEKLSCSQKRYKFYKNLIEKFPSPSLASESNKSSSHLGAWSALRTGHLNGLTGAKLAGRRKHEMTRSRAASVRNHVTSMINILLVKTTKVTPSVCGDSVGGVSNPWTCDVFYSVPPHPEVIGTRMWRQRFTLTGYQKHRYNRDMISMTRRLCVPWFISLFVLKCSLYCITDWECLSIEKNFAVKLKKKKRLGRLGVSAHARILPRELFS